MGLLRSDFHYAPTPDGAYALTHQGPVALYGASVYQLIDRLAPYLDGRYTLDDLVARLAPERRQRVRELISALTERGVIRSVSEPPAEVAADAPYCHELRFLGYFRDAPQRVFDAFRDQPTAVLGTSARLVTALARAALRAGIRDLTLITAGDDPTSPAVRLEPARRDAEQRVRHRRLVGEREADLRAVLSGAEIVLYAGEGLAVRRAELLERVCAQSGRRLAQAVAVENDVWLAGPAGPAGEWSSGSRRLRAWYSGGRCSGAGMPAAAATVAASQLVHGVLRDAAGIAAPESRLVAVDTTNRRTRTHTFVPHPFARSVVTRTAEQFLRYIAELRDRRALTPDELARRAAGCVGDRLGLFGQPTEREFTQLPLHVCQMAVSDPVCLLDGVPPPAIGAGLDFTTARMRAALRAFALYSALMVDPRRLATARPVGEGDADRALADLRAGRIVGQVWGYADGRAVPVDARTAFPVLRDRAVDLVSGGVAAGYDWPEAVRNGLLGQCRRLTVAALDRSAAPVPRIEPDGTALPLAGARYLGMLADLGERVGCFDITGPLGVPTVVCARGDAVAGCASGRTAGEALSEALEQTLLHYQAEVSGQPEYAPTALPALPPARRAPRSRPAPDNPPLDAAGLWDALRRQGHRPAVVLLDHDPAATSVLPFVVNVVLPDA
jgi:hypothetical protein